MIDDHSSALPAEESLFGDVTSLIEQARGRVALTVNAELTMLYWGIGTRIREDVLGFEKPEMMRFASVYESREILVPLVPILTWSHFLQLIALRNGDERRFYAGPASSSCTSHEGATSRARCRGRPCQSRVVA